MSSKSAGEAEYWWRWAFHARMLETPEEVVEELEELEREFEARRGAWATSAWRDTRHPGQPWWTG